LRHHLQGRVWIAIGSGGGTRGVVGLYFCVVTGDAATDEWEAIHAAAVSAVVPAGSLTYGAHSMLGSGGSYGSGST